MGGDYFLATVMANTLTKLILRLTDMQPPAPLLNSLRAVAMLMMTSTIRVGQSPFVVSPLDKDSYDRILLCLKVLTQQASNEVHDIFLKSCHEVYSEIVKVDDQKTYLKQKKAKKETGSGVEELVVFRQLKSRTASTDTVSLVCLLTFEFTL